MRSNPADIDNYRDHELTLDALAGAASRLLRRLDLRAGDGRVADRLDARGIRYYQTLGVVDKPLRYDGRRAVYGYRHLLQLLAVRKLQQEGHPLQVIQQALAGRSTETLEQALTAAAEAHTTGQSAAPITEVRLRDVRTDDKEMVGTQRLVAAHVAPGVIVTVDPTVVADPDGLIGKVKEVLARLGTLP